MAIDKPIEQNKRMRDRKTEEMPDFMKISIPVNILFSALFVLLALICIVPAIFCMIISLSSETESIAKIGYSFTPLAWSLDAYAFLWKEKGMIGNAFLISIIVTVLGTGLGLILNATMGYVLSRPGYRYRKFFSIFVLLPMLFSGGMVASYMINRQVLQLGNTLLALILPLAVGTWYVMILSTFFRTTVPEALVESAKLDGASQLRIFTTIVLPISLPAIATIALYLTFNYWNDWFQAMLYLDSNYTKLFPLQYVLVKIQKNVQFIAQNPQLITGTENLTANIPSETVRMAIVMIIVIPIAAAYPFFQRYFVTGLTIGAVKG